MSYILNVSREIEKLLVGVSAINSVRVVKLVFVATIVFSVVSFVATLDSVGLLEYLPFSKSQMLIVGLTCFLINLSLTAMIYLQTGELPFNFFRKSESIQAGSLGELEALRSSINELRKQIDEQSNGD